MNIERPEELSEYLRLAGHIGKDERVQISTLAGGVSNRTVLVERPGGDRWVVKQALEKLRVPIEWTCSPERIFREALGLRWLEKVVPSRVPAFVFEDRDHYVFAMEAVAEPHENWKRMLLGGRLETEHVRAFARLLAAVHRGGYRHRDQVAEELRDWTFFEALRLEPYYAYTARQVDRASDFLEQLIESTREHRQTIVHGDYSPKNILVARKTIVLLDHEVIHFGDPAFDLGFSMTHLLSKAHHLRDHRSAFLDAARAYWNEYYGAVEGAAWSTDVERRAVAHAIGCLLARVAGKSRLEYLQGEERQRQKETVLTLMRDRPAGVADLIRRFHEAIESRE